MARYKICPKCGGTGKIKIGEMTLFGDDEDDPDPEKISMTTTCDRCNGIGMIEVPYPKPKDEY